MILLTPWPNLALDRPDPDVPTFTVGKAGDVMSTVSEKLGMVVLGALSPAGWS